LVTAAWPIHRNEKSEVANSSWGSSLGRRVKELPMPELEGGVLSHRSDGARPLQHPLLYYFGLIILVSGGEKTTVKKTLNMKNQDLTLGTRIRIRPLAIHM
jgi:hypothetical protein